MKKATTSSRIKEVMYQRGLKQIDIVRLCEPYSKKYNIKMGRNDISQYVSGKFEPKQDKLTILALALNVNETWLMGYDVPMEREKPKEENHLITYINSQDLTEEEQEEVIGYIEFVIKRRKLRE